MNRQVRASFALAGERSTGDRRTQIGLQTRNTMQGYTGTQVFSTDGATKDFGEPNHCGVLGGASFWFAYTAPESGTITDTITDSQDATATATLFVGN